MILTYLPDWQLWAFFSIHNFQYGGQNLWPILKNVLVIVGYGHVVCLNTGFRGQRIRFLGFQMCKTPFLVFFQNGGQFL